MYCMYTYPYLWNLDGVSFARRVSWNIFRLFFFGRNLALFFFGGYLLNPDGVCLKSCQSCGWVVSWICMSNGTHMNESWDTYKWVMSLTWTGRVTHINESCHTCEWVMSQIWMSHVIDMGWLRLLGSIKLQVSFAEYCLFFRALLQMKPIV